VDFRDKEYSSGFMLRNTAESDNARMPDKDNLRDLEDSELKFVPISIQQLACDSGGKLREVQRRSRRPVRLGHPGPPRCKGLCRLHPGLCPNCRSEVHEKTLVQPIGNSDAANWI